MAAVHAGAGAYVHQVVARVNGVLVVLNHNNGVAQVAQVNEGFDEPVVVALMEANRRLVEHIERTHEARAKLRCQTDALRLAATPRVGAALKC